MFSRVPRPHGPDDDPVGDRLSSSAGDPDDSSSALLHSTSDASTSGGPESAAFTFDDEAFNRLTGDADWWLNAIESDSFDSPMPFDASESGLWNGRFVPPPPRPPFLDESIASDGLTTCDLCTWAWHDRNAFSLDGSIGEAAGELGWAFTLIIVSVISALLGAIIMVIVLRCRRLKSSNANGTRQLTWWSRASRNPTPPNGRSSHSIKQSADSIRSTTSLHNNPGVWTWLSNRRASASPDHHPMGAPSASPAENHYTHMDDSYSPVGVGDEALYAELDRESIRSANPSYQNTAYSQCGEIDQEVPIVSSAPSSAYYSDLSTTGTGTTTTTGAYEVVGLTHLSQPMPNWEASDQGSNGRRPPRLAAINETTTTLPSDYV